MPKFLVRYAHIKKVFYEQWVEADTEEEAIEEIADGGADLKNAEKVGEKGLGVKDFEVVDKIGW